MEEQSPTDPPRDRRSPAGSAPRSRPAKAAFTPPPVEAQQAKAVPRARAAKSAPPVLFQPPTEDPPTDEDRPPSADAPAAEDRPGGKKRSPARVRPPAGVPAVGPDQPAPAAEAGRDRPPAADQAVSEPEVAGREPVAGGDAVVPARKATTKRTAPAKKTALAKRSPAKAAAATETGVPVAAVTSATPAARAPRKTTTTPKPRKARAAEPVETTPAPVPVAEQAAPATQVAPETPDAPSTPATPPTREAAPGRTAGGPGPGLTARLLDHPGYAPELLAAGAVEALGPAAQAWAERLRATYPTAPPDGLARLATRRFVRLARAGGAAAAAAGSLAPVAELAMISWTHAGLVLHLAAAYGHDPTHPDRAVDLLVLSQVHPDEASARDTLSAAQRAEPEEDPGLHRVAEAAWRLAVPLAAQAGGWLALRLAARLVPGAAVLASAAGDAATAERLAARAVARYRSRTG